MSTLIIWKVICRDAEGVKLCDYWNPSVYILRQHTYGRVNQGMMNCFVSTNTGVRRSSLWRCEFYQIDVSEFTA